MLNEEILDREEKHCLRIAAFGIRSLPPCAGSAGADKFALELYPRIARKGHTVTVYNRIYRHEEQAVGLYQGITTIGIRTVRKSGFDSLWHSLKCTFHIIRNNTADIVHIHNGGNSIWALPLRLFGKRVFISQDGIDWKREKWPWYGKAFLALSAISSVYASKEVIFDNVFAKEWFEKKFRRQFSYIPYGSELPTIQENREILQHLGLQPREYFLFVGRFIPDKGIHYLIRAFEQTSTHKKLVLVGGSPNPGDYEKKLRQTTDPRILFTGYIYGDDVHTIMANAYSYIQPSDVEGLSPVLLTVLWLGTPVICSDIQENLFIVRDNALIFRKSDVQSLAEMLRTSLVKPDLLLENARRGKRNVNERFNWDSVVEQHLELFRQS